MTQPPDTNHNRRGLHPPTSRRHAARVIMIGGGNVPHKALATILMCMLVSLAHGVELTHGTASGDVSSTSAVIWARCDRAAEVVVDVQPAIGSASARLFTSNAMAADDFTARVPVDGLSPGTLYRYDTLCKVKRRRSAPASGVFRTAPIPEDNASLSLLWSGDLAGQRYCRRPGIGYRIFAPMADHHADFFVANGDMIYADNDCPAQGIEAAWKNIPADFTGIGNPALNWEDAASVAETFNAHWRYNRADPHFQAFLAGTSMYVQWDDHEVINDFGAPWQSYPPQGARTGYEGVVAAGRKSLFDYHPIARNAADPERIYRSFRWGAHAELFILDARSYRSENTREDGDEKTMLGKAQLKWLIEGLAASTATWKIISNDVPLSVPTGSRADEFGRDAFANGGMATGFEAELQTMVSAIDAHNVENVVFIATDVHSAAQIRYERDYDKDGDTLLFHEFIAGPLSAIRGPAPVTLDPTLGPVMIYAEGGLFNYGTVTIDSGAGARLVSDIRDESGRQRPGSELILQPR